MQVNRIVLRSVACVASLLVAGLSLPPRSVKANDGGRRAQILNPAGEGRRLFLRENCYGCHGGHGGGGMGPNFRDDRPTKDDVKNAVEHGLPGGMPKFEQLEDIDIQNLNAYIQSLRTPQEPVFWRWWEPVPSQ
jgi:cytochrome c551